MMATTAAVRERPILFSGAMVRAILDGSKTQTRRVMNPQPQWSDGVGCWLWDRRGARRVIDPDAPNPPPYGFSEHNWRYVSPYGVAGDRLWVRESFASAWCGADEAVCYAADHSDEIVKVERWKPSIHMPRRLSRIILEIADIRAERLQAISNEDCRAEGIGDGDAFAYAINGVDDYPRRQCYRALWDSLNASRGYGWNTNPWVWVLSFKRVAD